MIPFITSWCLNPPIWGFKVDGCREETSDDYIRILSLEILYNINDKHLDDILIDTSPKSSNLQKESGYKDIEESSYISYLTSYSQSENNDIAILSNLILDKINEKYSFVKDHYSRNEDSNKSKFCNYQSPFSSEMFITDKEAKMERPDVDWDSMN